MNSGASILRPAIRLALVAAIVACPAAAHDGYEGWRSPEGVSCCDNRDCAPAEPCFVRGVGIGAVAPDGSCVALDPAREIKPPAPVTRPAGLHVCWGWIDGRPWQRCWALLGGV